MTNGDLPSESHSITRIIQQLRAQDATAAQELWRRYFERLLPLARARVRALPNRAVDEEDILVSVFDRFFRAAREGRFVRLQDRDDLWQILLMLTERKVADQYRRSHAQKRGGDKVSSESDLSEVDFSQIRELADQEPRPEFVAAFNENLVRALTRLEEEKAREVALLRLEGYANREIAEKLDIGLSTVERKIRVIREVWQEVFSE